MGAWASVPVESYAAGCGEGEGKVGPMEEGLPCSDAEDSRT